MEIAKVFALQERAAKSNVMAFPDEFKWSDRALELIIDTHVVLGNDTDITAHRKQQKDSDSTAFETMNVIVNLAYDAGGSVISALRLLKYGVLADAWSLIRGAFESSCYAEFFCHEGHKVKDYLLIGERLMSNRSVDIRQEVNRGELR